MLTRNRIVFSILGLVNLLTIGVSFLGVAFIQYIVGTAATEDERQAAGMGYLLLTPVIMASIPVLIVNVVLISYALRRWDMTFRLRIVLRVWLGFSAVVLLLVLALFLFALVAQK